MEDERGVEESEEIGGVTQPFVGMEMSSNEPMNSSIGGHSSTNDCSSTAMGSIQKSALVDIFKSGDLDFCCKAIKKIVGASMKPNLSDEEEQKFRDLVCNEKSTFKALWQKANRMTDRFTQRHGTYLQSTFDLPTELRATSGMGVVGRPAVEYSALGVRRKRTKEKELSELLIDEPRDKILKSVTRALEGDDPTDKDLRAIIKELLKSPTRPSKIREKLKAATPSPMSIEEAVSLMIDSRMPVSTYEMLKRSADAHDFSLYPPYYLLRKYRKDFCRPAEQLELSDTLASVSLQALLDHTVDRIFKLQQEPLLQFAEKLKNSTLKLQLIASWGFDGSTGQSQYKQRLNANENATDSGIFVTTMIPLQLQTEEGKIVWRNQAPQSVRFCRPLRIQFLKETEDSIHAERNWVDSQIRNLVAHSITESGISASIKYSLHLTVIDGKVLSILSGASSHQVCPICGATPSEFNVLNRPLKPIPDCNLQYGISPLHAWIRFLEFCLHLSYRNVDGIKTWRVKGGDKNPQLNERKRKIQEALWEKLSLRVDFPKPGGAGSSNDGNTARRAFSIENQVVFAEILGIELWLVQDLHVILCVISSSLPVDSKKFGEFCRPLADRYVKAYPWFYMPATLHKILIHGEQIISRSALPMGMLSEQAGESRNKLYRQDREMHARKTSRKENLLDVFNRAMDSSDPFISELSMSQRREKSKKLPLPSAAIALLQAPDDPNPELPARQLYSEEDDDSEIESFKEVDGALDDVELVTEQIEADE